MQPTEHVEAVSGKGIREDASYGRARRQILLVSEDTLTQFDIHPGQVRENIVTRGLQFSEIAESEQLEIGEALLEVTGDCAPCERIDEIRPGLSSEIAGNRGILARVIRSGRISVGDSISVLHTD
jgi:MOSC domain-containing protein YiiM